jgi:hypothetical protein
MPPTKPRRVMVVNLAGIVQIAPPDRRQWSHNGRPTILHGLDPNKTYKIHIERFTSYRLFAFAVAEGNSPNIL